jgi:hypothetical protein
MNNKKYQLMIQNRKYGYPVWDFIHTYDSFDAAYIEYKQRVAVSKGHHSYKIQEVTNIGSPYVTFTDVCVSQVRCQGAPPEPKASVERRYVLERKASKFNHCSEEDWTVWYTFLSFSKGAELERALEALKNQKNFDKDSQWRLVEKTVISY